MTLICRQLVPIITPTSIRWFSSWDSLSTELQKTASRDKSLERKIFIFKHILVHSWPSEAITVHLERKFRLEIDQIKDREYV